MANEKSDKLSERICHFSPDDFIFQGFKLKKITRVVYVLTDVLHKKGIIVHKVKNLKDLAKNP